jgi:hypothetical protein
MKTSIPLLLLIFLLSACQTAPAATPAPEPTTSRASLPTATEAPQPTETAAVAIAATNPPDVFGVLDTSAVPMSFMFEPIVSEVFDQGMSAYVDSGSVSAFEIERVIVYYNQDGSTTAEVYYRVQTTELAVWYEDGGTLAEANWINDKCSYFDFLVTESQYILKNRRSCS